MRDAVTMGFPFPAESVTITGDARDVGVLATIRETGEYEPHLMALFAEVVGPEGVCVDVGANIGAHAVALARLATNGTVIAVEPEPGNVAHLQSNLESITVGDVRVRQLGLHSSEGMLRLHTSVAHPGGAFIATTGADDTDSVEIAVTTLDRLVETEGLARVDLIKIDVEGCEIGVLAGAERTLRVHRPVVIAECNPIPLWRFQRRRPSDLLEAMIRACGPVAFIRRDGAILPIHNSTHLDSVLAEFGLVDLVAGVAFEGNRRARLRWAAFAAVPLVARRYLRRLRDQRRAGAPPSRYVISPAGAVSATPRALTLRPGEQRTIELSIENRCDGWFVSDWPAIPIRVGARFRGLAAAESSESLRGGLTAPIPPAGQGSGAITIVAPDASGDYRIDISLVQEGYVWFDDFAPDFKATVALTVIDHS